MNGAVWAICSIFFYRPFLLKCRFRFDDEKNNNNFFLSWMNVPFQTHSLISKFAGLIIYTLVVAKIIHRQVNKVLNVILQL